MKQVLSVADFATILNLVDRSIAIYERVPISPFCKEQERTQEIKKHKNFCIFI